MKLFFKNLPDELLPGVQALCAQLHLQPDAHGLPVTVCTKPGADLLVEAHSGGARICYDRKIHFFRCLGILAEHLCAGETDFCVTEHPQFRTNGAMFDVSQGNAAPNIQQVFNLLRKMALLGLNLFMLYCEDTYEVPGEPYFGYMRAKYTQQELRACDDYADMFGIEMMPCIQTLAHLQEVLKWPVYQTIKENDVCLLVGEDETYAFLRRLLQSATAAFRSRRVHLGMDEAYDLGRGAYLDKNGLRMPQEIMKQHLEKVLQITRELGLQPMMWSDMFFSGIDYRGDAPVPEQVVRCCPPDVQLVYWDYYRNDSPSYDAAFRRHRQFGRPVVFAGGIWTWIGFAPHWERTVRSTDAALLSCKKQGIEEVFATVWGDNGTECPMEATVFGLTLYAQHGYYAQPDEAAFARKLAFVTGVTLEDFYLLEQLDKTPGAQDGALTIYNPSKFLLWQDVMAGLCDKNIDGLPLNDFYAELYERLQQAAQRAGEYEGLFTLSALLARVLAVKSELGLEITRAYKQNDRAALQAVVQERLPELMRRMQQLRAHHRQYWLCHFKTFGWNVLDMRYGSLLARMDTAAFELQQYLEGKVDRLEELEEPRLDFNCKPGMISEAIWFDRIVSGSRIAPQR